MPFSRQERFLFRHLMANVKVDIPRFFRYEPDIAFGIGDVSGQTALLPLDLRRGFTGVQAAHA